MMLANPDQSQKLAWVASIVREQLGEDRRGSSLFAAEKNAGGRSRRRRREQRHRRLVLLLPRKQLFGKVEEKAKNAQWFWRSYFSILKGRSNVSLLDQRDLRTFLMFDGCREIFSKIDEVCQNKIFYQKLRENDFCRVKVDFTRFFVFLFLQLKSKKYSFKVKVMK